MKEGFIVHLWRSGKGLGKYGQMSTLLTEDLYLAALVKGLLAGALGSDFTGEIRQLRLQEQKPSQVIAIDPAVLAAVNQQLAGCGFPPLAQQKIEEQTA